MDRTVFLDEIEDDFLFGEALLSFVGVLLDRLTMIPSLTELETEQDLFKATEELQDILVVVEKVFLMGRKRQMLKSDKLKALANRHLNPKHPDDDPHTCG